MTTTTPPERYVEQELKVFAFELTKFGPRDQATRSVMSTRYSHYGDDFVHDGIPQADTVPARQIRASWALAAELGDRAYEHLVGLTY